MKTTALLSALLSSLLIAGPARSAEPSDILDTAVSAGSFQTLAAALKAADLVDTLRGDGPFTVFAPTDKAFARLPEGTVAQLLKPENKGRLQAILTHHVVPGRIASSDLLSTTAAVTVNGSQLAIGLRVGDANVTSADIECSNGIIHVIDSVLLPPERPATTDDTARDIIRNAVELGAPLYNDGDAAACASVYEAAGKRLLSLPADRLGDLDRHAVRAALDSPAHSAKDRAWTFRHAFDQIIGNEAFEPRLEAPLPKGFPGPGPLGRVVVKSYPVYRAARAEGGNSFWTLFRHIKKNDVQMTAPVETTMDDGMRAQDMAFLYEASTQGEAGRQGSVAVVDLESARVLSIGMRGDSNDDSLAAAKAMIEARLAADGWERAGAWRLMGYNSPMVPAAERFWELQLPVTN